MEKSFLNRSNGDTTLGKNSEEELNRTKKNPLGVLLNGKTHSLSTEHTINKYQDNTDKQRQNFIENIEKFPKYNAESDREPTWERQFLKGVSSEMSLNGSEINKTKKSSEAAEKPEKGISVLRYKEEEGPNIKEIELKKMHDYSNQDNPFSMKTNSNPIQSRVFVIPPLSSEGSRIFTNQQSKINANNHKQILEEESKEKLNQDEGPTTKSQESKEFSKNIFEIPNKNIFEIPIEQQKLKSSQSNLFEIPETFLGTKQNSMEDEEDQSSNLYDKSSKTKVKQSKFTDNQGYSMVALQKILEASGLYKDYLQKVTTKRQSICIPEIQVIEGTKLPQQYFFKPERIVFNRIKQDLARQFNYNGFHIIGKVNRQRTKLFYQDLKQDRLWNMKGLKCSEITFQQDLQMSPNIEYDYENKRFFIFSNKEQKIYAYSEANRDLICTFSTKKKVINPHLYLHQINNRIFLLLIGGYSKIEKKIVQGNKFIQIFQLKKWEIELKSQIIKLVIGRISPIVATVTEKNETKILVMGGNSIALLEDNDRLNYEYERDINQSTNLTGISIPSQEIIELFDYSEQALLANHSIKILNPQLLHDGCVIPVNNTFYLLLPECKHLIQMKMLNKEINLIEGKRYQYIPYMKEIHRRELCLNYDRGGGIEIYQITEEGLFSIVTQETQKKDNYCLIY